MPPDNMAPITYVKPRSGVKPVRVDHIEGKVMLAPDFENWTDTARVLRIGLFDAKQALIASVVPAHGGQFAIKDIAPGVYTLVISGDKLNPLSIPLKVMSPTAESDKIDGKLQFYMRSQDDRRKSVAILITDETLRSELLARVAKDQNIRNEMILHGVEHPDKDIQNRMVAIDAENLIRMKEIVRQYGWPGPNLVGMDGTEAAFLLVQHAPLDFQKEMLPRIARAYRSGQLSGESYALLLDRVLMRDGKPQLYGTQTRSITEWKNREPVFYTIEDEAHVDQRRAKVGLPSLAEYKKLLKEAYFPEAAPASQK